VVLVRPQEGAGFGAEAFELGGRGETGQGDFGRLAELVLERSVNPPTFLPLDQRQ
jgi:hypothetical protein